MRSEALYVLLVNCLVIQVANILLLPLSSVDKDPCRWSYRSQTGYTLYRLDSLDKTQL